MPIRSRGDRGHRAARADAPLAKILEERRRDLHASYVARSEKVLVGELWSLGGDMPHLDFDMTHLTGADTLMALRENISLEALLSTRDLDDAVWMAALMRDQPLSSRYGAASLQKGFE